MYVFFYSKKISSWLCQTTTLMENLLEKKLIESIHICILLNCGTQTIDRTDLQFCNEIQINESVWQVCCDKMNHIKK